MRYVSYDTVKQNMGNAARSVQDFGAFLGRSPYSLGIAAQLFKKNTSTMLLDSLMNIHQLPKNRDKYKPISDMAFEWGVDTEKIKQVKIVADVTTDGTNGTDVVIRLAERYFNPNETFRIEGSRDTLFVTMVPRRISINDWEYVCRAVVSDISRGINLGYAKKGNTVRFLGNHHPEGSDHGYSKFQSNIERHRNYLTLHRVGHSTTGQYALQETKFIEMAGKGKNGNQELVYYKLESADKMCLEQFYEIRNNHLLFGKSNHDEKGRCLLQEADGRDIPIGDGIISQLERYAEKYAFSKLTTNVLRDVIKTMKTKSQTPTGNHYLVLCNESFQEMWWDAMVEELRGLALPATAFYTKGNDKVKSGLLKVDGGKGTGPDYAYNNLAVGATFTSYEYNGNVISIAVDRAMTYEYGDRAYGIFLDMTQDLNDGRPAMELFTLEGGELFTGTIKGLGGKTGSESGDIASPVHGMEYHVAGYSGAAVYNPFRSFILEEAVASYI